MNNEIQLGKPGKPDSGEDERLVRRSAFIIRNPEAGNLAYATGFAGFASAMSNEIQPGKPGKPGSGEDERTSLEGFFPYPSAEARQPCICHRICSICHINEQRDSAWHPWHTWPTWHTWQR